MKKKIEKIQVKKIKLMKKQEGVMLYQNLIFTYNNRKVIKCGTEYIFISLQEKKIHYECDKCKLNFVLKSDLDSWTEFENFYNFLTYTKKYLYFTIIL